MGIRGRESLDERTWKPDVRNPEQTSSNSYEEGGTAMTSKIETSKLIREVNRLHKQITEANQTSLDSAIEAGEMLINLKKTVPHGEWADYLSKNCPDISERTAQDYMWA